MKVSANELVVTATKACVGAGVARGVSEDIGKACLELALDGRNPISSLLKALSKFDGSEENISGFALVKDEQAGYVMNCAEVLRCGPSIVDLARVNVSNAVVRVKELDHPDILWGLAKTSGRPFSLEFKNASDSDNGAQEIVLKIENTGEVEDAPMPVGGIEIDDKQWHQLCKHAAEILVPADATNRADAGAGLTDND